MERQELIEPEPEHGRPGGRGIVNAPGVVLALAASFVAIHAGLQWVSPRFAEQVMLTFAFSPARYVDLPGLDGMSLPGGRGAAVWTFVSHMFLHGDWTHVIVNCIWLLAFGSVVARRFGAVRFLVYSGFCAAAGAAASLALYHDEFSLLIGASGAVSGQLGGAVRLIYAMPGGLSQLGTRDLTQVRSLGILDTLRTPGAVVFLAVWLGITLLFGVNSFGLAGEGGRIAWEAHLGGFVAGFFCFSLFDRLSNR